MKKRLTALALACTMVLGTTALAVGGSKTISVTPMDMTINGQAVTPTKTNGEPAEVFAYDGATYVPLRYLSEVYRHFRRYAGPPHRGADGGGW